MNTGFKKTIALLLILCLSVLMTGCGPKPQGNTGEDPGQETPDPPKVIDEQAFADLTLKMYNANKTDSVFSRHSSVCYTAAYPFGEGQDLIRWQTKDNAYSEQGDGNSSQYTFREGTFYRMDHNEETGASDMVCGIDFGPGEDNWYSFMPENIKDFTDPEHERLIGYTEEDGMIVFRLEQDAAFSRKSIETLLNRAYEGETVITETVAKAENLDIISVKKSIKQGEEETVFYTVTVDYDGPEPIGCRTLRAAFEREPSRSMLLTFIMDPETDHERIRSMAVAPGFGVTYISRGIPYVEFGDPGFTTDPYEFWDRASDNTWYIYTDPDSALMAKYDAVSSAAAKRMFIRDDGPGVIKSIVKANSMDTLLGNHKSVFTTNRTASGVVTEKYYDKEGIYYESGPDERVMYLGKEKWAGPVSGGKRKHPECWFYAMSDAEVRAMVQPEFQYGIPGEKALEEVLTDYTENADGSITVISERVPGDDEGVPLKHRGDTLEKTYLTDKNYEMISASECYVRGSQRTAVSTSSAEYDVSYPEGLYALVQLRKTYSAANADKIQTVTVIYDSGKPTEQKWTMEAGIELTVQVMLRDGYRILSRETRDRADKKGTVVTVYAVPED